MTPIRTFAAVTGLTLVLFALGPRAAAVPARAQSPVAFGVPSIVDPIHTFGEPDIGVDVQGRVFVSGPTGTGTQRSVWFGSVDAGHTYRPITPGAPPNPITTFVSPPGGGDTELGFDHTGKQYFADLYALLCLRTATTSNGGAAVSQGVYGCATNAPPGADRQWIAVWDPPGGVQACLPTNGTTQTGALTYMEYNNLQITTGGAAQWARSCDGINYVNASPATTPGGSYAPFGPDGYPAIDSVSGKVFQAAGSSGGQCTGACLLMNVGTADPATGNLHFLDEPAGDLTKLIKIADNLPGDPDVLFPVLSIDSARNLIVAYATDADATHPLNRQVYVSTASAASGWRTWSTPVQVSQPPSLVNVFPWVKAGGAGMADVVWYGSDKAVDPSTNGGQAWNVFMSQVQFPVDGTGAITGAAPSVAMTRVTPHPMHYQSICLAGTGCIASQGNRNLADFFEVTVDSSGAALVVYPDTSNGLIQNPAQQAGQVVDHAGAPLVTVARQSSGPGVYGHDVYAPSSAPVPGLSDPAGDALYPVMGGTNVPGMDILGSSLALNGSTLSVATKVVDLSNPGATLATLNAGWLDFVTRWQMGNTLYYANGSFSSAGVSYGAGPVSSVDLCSVSACDPHVLIYPEAGFGGASEAGSVNCPPAPSAANPCTLTINVNAADVGSPSSASLLEEVGAYALATSHPQGVTTNAQALADNVPLEIDGVCCYNFQASALATATSGGQAGGQATPSGSAAAGSGALPFSAAAAHALPYVGIAVLAAGVIVVLAVGVLARRRRGRRPPPR